MGSCEGRTVGDIVGAVGLDVGVTVGVILGLALYAQHRVGDGDIQLLVAYGALLIPGGQVAEQYPAVIVGSVQET